MSLLIALGLVSATACVLTGCPAKTYPRDSISVDCMGLGGGYEGADTSAVEAACLADGGTGCDASEFIESDAAKCFYAHGEWSPEVDSSLDALLTYLPAGPYDTVVWGITDEDRCVTSIRAVDGVNLGSVCLD